MIDNHNKDGTQKEDQMHNPDDSALGNETVPAVDPDTA